jgi:ribonuclease BN (tRNA processing enzyme)
VEAGENADMKLRVLGCSGGIGGDLRTTALLIDDDILIDAGTGLGELSLDDMKKVRHIFLTHTHLDHIACLPLMVDSMFPYIVEPMVIRSHASAIEVIKKHIFNWAIWPDFASLPTADNPVMRYEQLRMGEVCTLNGRSFEMMPVNHIVPTVGYRIECASGVVAFSGDTTTNDTFWEALNVRDRLDVLIVEVAFKEAFRELSLKSRHYCPSLLVEDLKKLRHSPRIFLTHNKPGEEDLIFRQCCELVTDRRLERLRGGLVIEI